MFRVHLFFLVLFFIFVLLLYVLYRRDVFFVRGREGGVRGVNRRRLNIFVSKEAFALALGFSLPPSLCITVCTLFHLVCLVFLIVVRPVVVIISLVLGCGKRRGGVEEEVTVAVYMFCAMSKQVSLMEASYLASPSPAGCQAILNALELFEVIYHE